jgi:hypothetical protein
MPHVFPNPSSRKESVSHERIDDSPQFDGEERHEHEWRYEWAGRFTDDDDSVLDCACGTGYGSGFLRGGWVGVDRLPLCGNIVADLESWQPSFPFDVFVGLETIEHLADPANYVQIAKRARRWIVISTPVIPTAANNEYHLRDFSSQDIRDLFVDQDWTLHDEQRQDTDYGIWAFRRAEHGGASHSR